MSTNSSSITNLNPNPNPSPTKPPPLKTNHPTNQACAACKYQRRRCIPDCTLAPYFPAENQAQFLNAHRLFGVSNILKIIRHLDPHLRDEAMRSIIFESNARAFDPVGGCYRMVSNLHQQIARETAELECVLQQLALFRGNDAVNVNVNVNENVQQPQQDLGEFGYLCYDGNVGGEEGVVVVDGNTAGLEMEMLSLEQREVEVEVEVEEEKVEVADFVDAFDFSAKSLDLKEEINGIEHVQEQDLKEAASLFTLTNCNTSPV